LKYPAQVGEFHARTWFVVFLTADAFISKTFHFTPN
jgi:hypothetical protein